MLDIFYHMSGGGGLGLDTPKQESREDVGDILRNGGRTGIPQERGGAARPLLNSTASLITLIGIGEIL